jgi:hypothetical protein
MREQHRAGPQHALIASKALPRRTLKTTEPHGEEITALFAAIGKLAREATTNPHRSMVLLG